jgi:flagellin
MAISINTNNAAAFTQNTLNTVQRGRDKALADLASGTRLHSAADNPAASSIVQLLAAQIGGGNQAARGLNDALSLTQVAGGALQQLQDNTTSLRDLAVQAGDGALSASDLGALQTQADQLVASNRDIVQNTNFNGIPLLQGGSSLSFQSGPDSSQQLSLPGSDLAAQPGNGGLQSLAGGVDLSSQTAANQTLDNLDQDLATLANHSAAFGAAGNAIASQVGNLQTTTLNESTAQSRINDTDFATASSDLARQQILGQAGLAVQAQANVSPQLALGLLQGLGNGG